MVTPRLQGLSPATIQNVVAAAQALEAGRADAATAQLIPALASNPDHPEILRLHASILNLRGDYAAAVATMRRALAQRPDDPLYHNTLGSILGTGNDLDGAITALKRACELQPTLADAWYNLGVMLTHCVRRAEAIDALQRAVAINPRHMDARSLLGDMLRAENRIEEAETEYRRVIAERPWAGVAWLGLADLKSLRLAVSDIEHIRRALRDPRAGDDDLIALGFALAKGLDDECRYSESLTALAQANAIARRRKTWNAQGFSAVVTGLLDSFNPPPRHSPDANLGHDAIFVVSLPRSGSTLVEQILTSHSSVQGAGELPDLPLTLTEESYQRLVPFPLWVDKMHAEDWQHLGERYLQRTARWRSQRPMFVDKLPSNWMYIGAIRAMLPAAKIICCRRDPLETCFACYRQHLASNEYTRTFDDLAAYWRDFDRSIHYWRAEHSSHVHEHIYEDLIADPETSIRGLLEFCELPFEGACLRFYQNKRNVFSPSATQVRQPLRPDTARAPGYGALLDPLRTALDMPPFSG
ncbi:MAG: sulfotransferase [Rhodanobacteraceae bacterium]